MLRPEIAEDFPCCGSGRHTPTVQLHPKSIELVDCARTMRDLGKQPAEIIAHLLDVYSEEPPGSTDDEIPPEVVDRVLGAVRRELQRP